MRRFVLLAVVLAACSKSTGSGTEGASPQAGADVPTGDVAAACAAQKDGRTFTGFFSGPSDFARVLLCAGYKYRVSSDAGGIAYEVKSVMPGVQAPQVIDLIDGGGGPGGMGGVKEIRATASGVYEIRVRAAQAGAGANVTIERDGTWEKKN